MRILLLCALVAGACASSWNYDLTSSDGPSYWPDECVLPSSQSQSPIDIHTDDTETEYYDPSFKMNDGYSEVDVTVSNNGHTVQATLKSYENATLTGGGLSGAYRLAQFHLHWGSSDNQGSEHKVDGKQYPMEVHFVHYKVDYGSLGNAADKPDGLAVLAWFFEVKGENSAWEDVFDGLPLNEGSTFSIEDLDLTNMWGNVGTFYRYQGSLTTPPCYESVTWTVFKDKIEVDDAQMERVRGCKDSHGHEISNNFRPTQNLYGRTVEIKG